MTSFSRTRFGLLATVGFALAGCAPDGPSLELAHWELEGRELVLPVRLGSDEIAENETYRLRTSVELPESLRDQPVDLSLPFLPARAELRADGVECRYHEPTVEGRYRRATPHRWHIPTSVTADGYVDLELSVEHRWTKSGWLTVIPRLLPAGEADPLAQAIRASNVYGAWFGLAALLQIGLTCLLVFFLDRKRKPYLWFGIQAFTAIVYPAFTLGLTTDLFGVYDLPVMEFGLIVALFVSILFTHSFMPLGDPPRWLLSLLAIGGVLAVVVSQPFLATHIAARGVVLSVTIAIVYQLFTCARLLFKVPELRVSTMLLAAAWLSLGGTAWCDLLSWFAITEPLWGMSPGCMGLGAFAIFLSLLLSRSHILSLRKADGLNVALQDQVAQVEAQRTKAWHLNEELRAQIMDRSAQLFTAMSLLERRDRGAPRLEIGDVINDRYRILEALGAGAMGLVYKVERITDGGHWAMKIATEVHGTALARLAREAHLAATMTHPNIVRIRDIDVSTLGFMYLVMELVEGESLRERLRREERLSPRLVARILTQVADGLAALHGQGIAHRDLKPANVLLMGDKGEVVAKISDFGVSRFAHGRAPQLTPRSLIPPPPGQSSPPSTEDALTTQSQSEDDLDWGATGLLPDSQSSADRDLDWGVTGLLPESRSSADQDLDWGETGLVSDSGASSIPSRSRSRSRSSGDEMELTAAGLVAGTPHYIAPELAVGGDPSSAAADIFSLGVMAYELLTGTRPFNPPVVYSVMENQPIAPYAPLSLAESERALGELIERCLEVTAEGRPSAAEIPRLLESLVNLGSGARRLPASNADSKAQG